MQKLNKKRNHDVGHANNTKIKTVIQNLVNMQRSQLGTAETEFTHNHRSLSRLPK